MMDCPRILAFKWFSLNKGRSILSTARISSSRIVPGRTNQQLLNCWKMWATRNGPFVQILHNGSEKVPLTTVMSIHLLLPSEQLGQPSARKWQLRWSPIMSLDLSSSDVIATSHGDSKINPAHKPLFRRFILNLVGTFFRMCFLDKLGFFLGRISPFKFGGKFTSHSQEKFWDDHHTSGLQFHTANHSKVQ